MKKLFALLLVISICLTGCDVITGILGSADSDVTVDDTTNTPGDDTNTPGGDDTNTPGGDDTDTPDDGDNTPDDDNTGDDNTGDNTGDPECGHYVTQVTGKVDATCAAEGYTGDVVCFSCGYVVSNGNTIDTIPHRFVSGVCAVCATPEPIECDSHVDVNDDGYCDACSEYVIVVIDIYAINDLHGKASATDNQPGIGKLTTYLKQNMTANGILLSSGDMWQGSSESNLTHGALITDWMNAMGFVSMTLGNHEYDWGESFIADNAEIADFPFLAINAYSDITNQRVEYASASVVIDRGGVQIGIIGAIGDCYSSISGAVSDGFYFKTDDALAALVKAESDRLRAEGVDFIVYSIHDDETAFQSVLADGYVDLVFEAHTHQSYVNIDGGVYHLQGGGENKGLSYALISVNSANGNSKVTKASVIKSSAYSSCAEDPILAELLDKYSEQLDAIYDPIGYNKQYRDDTEVEQLVADLYYQYGIEKWGDEYDIVLAGGFVKTRSPYNVYKGNVTYADLCSILPFDNIIVLCSIQGKDLKAKFINTDNEDYYISYGDYDLSTIKDNQTYYIVVDQYTSSYAWNNITEVELSGDGIYARDLVADFISKGSWA